MKLFTALMQVMTICFLQVKAATGSEIQHPFDISTPLAEKLQAESLSGILARLVRIDISEHSHQMDNPCLAIQTDQNTYVTSQSCATGVLDALERQETVQLEHEGGETQTVFHKIIK